MDIYQILVTYNKPWSTNEKIAFGGLLLGVAIGLIFCLYWKKINKRQAVSIFLLSIFLSIVFESTIFTRVELSTRKYELIPFWSWHAIYKYHSWELLKEDILNCILLMPVGILYPFILNREPSWKEALALGVFISLVIECSQLLFMRGLFEWDDIIHNGFGCMVACLCTNRWIRKQKKD